MKQSIIPVKNIVFQIALMLFILGVSVAPNIEAASSKYFDKETQANNRVKTTTPISESSAVLPSPNQNSDYQETKASESSDINAEASNIAPIRDEFEDDDDGDDSGDDLASPAQQSAPSVSHAVKQDDGQEPIVAASYDHSHHSGHGHNGWLDMGAWTGGKGSFGWYADFPVGSKGHGYGRK